MRGHFESHIAVCIRPYRCRLL